MSDTNADVPTDDEVKNAAAELRKTQPEIGRRKMLKELKEANGWALSEPRLKKLVPTTNPGVFERAERPAASNNNNNNDKQSVARRGHDDDDSGSESRGDRGDNRSMSREQSEKLLRMLKERGMNVMANGSGGFMAVSGDLANRVTSVGQIPIGDSFAQTFTFDMRGDRNNRGNGRR